MSYTPVELRHVRVPRRFLGYDRAAVEKLLEEVAASFETVWRDRADLAEKVEELEARLVESTSQERLLTDTLVSAERAADEVRDRVRREGELALAEAHGEARAVVRSAQAEHERLVTESRRITALLRAALDVVDEGAGALPAAAAGSAPGMAVAGAAAAGALAGPAVEAPVEAAVEPDPHEAEPALERPVEPEALVDEAPEPEPSFFDAGAESEAALPADEPSPPEPSAFEPAVFEQAVFEHAPLEEDAVEDAVEEDAVEPARFEFEPAPPAARLESVPSPAAEPEPEPEPVLEDAPEPEPAEDPALFDDDSAPGWPVYRRAAGGGSGFDWGD